MFVKQDRNEEEEEEFQQRALLASCLELSYYIVNLYNTGYSFAEIAIKARGKLSEYNIKRQLNYLPRRKKTDGQWIDNSWKEPVHNLQDGK